MSMIRRLAFSRTTAQARYNLTLAPSNTVGIRSFHGMMTSLRFRGLVFLFVLFLDCQIILLHPQIFVL